MTEILWTVETLKELMEVRFADSAIATSAALAAAEKAVNAAREAQDRATTKAEGSSDKQFASVNEFRATLSDQAKNLMPRAEADVLLTALRHDITSLQSRLDVNSGANRRGLTEHANNQFTTTTLISVIALLSSVGIMMYVAIHG